MSGFALLEPLDYPVDRKGKSLRPKELPATANQREYDPGYEIAFHEIHEEVHGPGSWHVDEEDCGPPTIREGGQRYQRKQCVNAKQDPAKVATKLRDFGSCLDWFHGNVCSLTYGVNRRCSQPDDERGREIPAFEGETDSWLQRRS